MPPPGRAAPEAHPVFAAPPEAAGLRAQLPPTADLADQDGEPGPGHNAYLLCESNITKSL